MGWFFRVIELADGRWACRHGRVEYDAHPELRHAIIIAVVFACMRRGYVNRTT